MSDSFAIQKRPEKPKDKSGLKEIRSSRGLEFDVAEHLQFFQAFIREPASVGALSPSSRALARAMVEGCNLRKADTVVEMGPGTGAFTGLILNKIGVRTTFFTLELDPVYARSLKVRFPSLIVYNDSAERLPEYLELHGKNKADYIISGLPWASLPSDIQNRIMQGILYSIAPDGIFTTFAYVHARWLPKAQKFRQGLERYFARVEISRVIWRNFPPAFVYRCSHAFKQRSGRPVMA